MASASMMTSVVKGKRKSEVKTLYDELMAAVANAGAAYLSLSEAQQVVVLTARNVPSRKNCAVMAWQALNTALDGREQQVAVG